jgi:hypothetical protein
VLLDHVDREIVLTACGVAMNLASDAAGKVLLDTVGGVKKLVDILGHAGLRDLAMSTVACRALHNYIMSAPEAGGREGRGGDATLRPMSFLCRRRLGALLGRLCGEAEGAATGGGSGGGGGAAVGGGADYEYVDEPDPRELADFLDVALHLKTIVAAVPRAGRAGPATVGVATGTDGMGASGSLSMMGESKDARAAVGSGEVTHRGGGALW